MGRYTSRFELRLGDDDDRALRDAAARFDIGRAELVRTLMWPVSIFRTTD
jgi:hypothetical protein